jgi:CRISPR-associated endonuclease Csn1
MIFEETVFGFDLGKGSIGYCARRGAEILDLGSMLIPAEHASTQDIAKRRRTFRTRQAHKKRELWLNKIWSEAGLTPLIEFYEDIDKNKSIRVKAADDRLKTEYTPKNSNTIYNSALLRVALMNYSSNPAQDLATLIQGQALSEWQIYKALHAAIQHRGYKHSDYKDHEIENTENAAEALDEAKENYEAVQEYEKALQETFSAKELHYPCYFEAKLQGLISDEYPLNLNKIKLRIEDISQAESLSASRTVRRKGRVAPRELVAAELRVLFDNAKEIIPNLKNTETDYFLYGPAKEAFVTVKKNAPKEFKRQRGTEWEAQGVLAQKTPRFDNRMMDKCCLMPLRNTCNAKDTENSKFKLLMHLKNFRFTDVYGERRGFTREEFKKVYGKCFSLIQEKISSEVKSLKLTKAERDKIIKTVLDATFHDPNFNDEIKFNTSGRSSFCRPALKIINEILENTLEPSQIDISKHVQNSDETKPHLGVTKSEIERVTSRLGETWEKISIQDNRYEIDLEDDKYKEIALKIGSVNNPVVRNRLQVFINLVEALAKKHGTPDKIIFEFIRGEGGYIDGNKVVKNYNTAIKDNEKKNDKAAKDLLENGLEVNKKNIDKYKLWERQGRICPYTGEALIPEKFREYQIDHIVPYSDVITSDGLFNKVLCLGLANQEKGKRTAYEWISSKGTDEWIKFQARIRNMKALPKRTSELLINTKPLELFERYTGLAETAHVARLAQNVTAKLFGWGLQTRDDERKIFVNSGAVTAKLRSKYKLERLLVNKSEEEWKNLAPELKKKNRDNKLHHALDAYCISCSQSIKEKPDSSINDSDTRRFSCEALEKSKENFEKRFKEISAFNKTRDVSLLLPKQTIYKLESLKKSNKKGILVKFNYLIYHKDFYSYLSETITKDEISKRLEKLWDLAIKKDLKDKLEKMDFSKENWLNTLKSYRHPHRKTLVKRIQIINKETETETYLDDNRLCLEEFKDFSPTNSLTKNQFKETESYKGQVIYFDEKRKARVFTLYAHKNTKLALDELKAKGYKLYENGCVFETGDSILVESDFKVRTKEYRAGVYLLSSIKSSGQISLNNQTISVSANTLTQARFIKIDPVKNKKEAALV